MMPLVVRQMDIRMKASATRAGLDAEDVVYTSEQRRLSGTEWAIGANYENMLLYCLIWYNNEWYVRYEPTGEDMKITHDEALLYSMQAFQGCDLIIHLWTGYLAARDLALAAQN